MHSDWKILVIGGDGTNGSMEIYDPHNPEENRELATRLLTPRSYHTSAVLEDGKVLIAGGWDDHYNPLSSTEIFDPVSGKIEPGPPMGEKRVDAASAVLNGIVYVCGGGNGSYLTSCEKFESNQWRPIASMKTARAGHGMASVNGYLFACGGRNGEEILSSCERYSPDEDRWELIQPMKEARYSFGAATLNGHLYVCGGEDQSGRPMRSCEVYDPSKNEWSPIADMNKRKWGHSLIAMDGKLYAVGGEGGKFYQYCESVLAFFIHFCYFRSRKYN